MKNVRALLFLNLFLFFQPYTRATMRDKADKAGRGLIIAGTTLRGLVAVTGPMGLWGLYKAFRWSQQETGLKQKVGKGVLACATVAVLAGAGYLLTKVKK